MPSIQIFYILLFERHTLHIYLGIFFVDKESKIDWDSNYSHFCESDVKYFKSTARTLFAKIWVNFLKLTKIYLLWIILQNWCIIIIELRLKIHWRVWVILKTISKSAWSNFLWCKSLSLHVKLSKVKILKVYSIL